jgi:dTDP-4-dehydrorhamnose 3,5-epimerase
MKITPTQLQGVFVIETDLFQDERGAFIKTFHKDTFEAQKIHVDFKESFYSLSKKGVIRGMHFHLPPKAHAKLVYVTSGAVLDVILDMRKDSPTYGKYTSIELSAENHKMTFIPIGCAHGFLSLEDNTCMVYLQSGVYDKECDAGVTHDSFGMVWPIENPIMSKRDKEFIKFTEFNSPFTMNHESTD